MAFELLARLLVGHAGLQPPEREQAAAVARLLLTASGSSGIQSF